MKFIDLFSGAGGLSLGFEMAGYRAAYAVEQDKWAAETHSWNMPRCRIDVCNIRDIPDKQIRNRVGFLPNVVVGGPPCQGFSHSNTNSRDPKDPRNSLFQDFVRFLRVLQPEACVIENVKGLITARNECGESVLQIIKESLADSGYEVSSKLLDAADYGVPQHRDRLFIVGIRRDIKTRFSWPTVSHGLDPRPDLPLFDIPFEPHVSLWQAISDLPQITHADKSAPLGYASNPANAFQALMREGAEQIYNHEPMRHSARLIERFAKISYGESEADVPHDLSPRRRGHPATVSGKRYGQNSRRQHPDFPCNTIPASSHTNFLHPFLHRNFTVRELARIQSFPDRYVFQGKRAVLSRSLLLKKGLAHDAYLDQRAQVGNAVPPLLARAIAARIGDTLSYRKVMYGS